MPSERSSRSSSSAQAGVLGYWNSLSVQERLMFLMTVGLIAASFFLGYFYGQLKVLKDGGSLGSAAGANPTAGAQAPAPQAPEPVQITDELWDEIIADAAAAKGPENAEVTFVEFTDYQCPFCKRHFDETAGQIEQNYVDTNQVRYLIRDLPLPFHGNANAAAQAARCAGDQNQYWEMHDQLFETQETWSTGDPSEHFSGLAGDLGLNVSTFDSCLSSEKYKAAVDADAALASKVGATGTPSFFVNGNMIVGAQPFSAFESAIEAEL